MERASVRRVTGSSWSVVGILQAGAFVPEVVLEHPEKVEQLHREFVHAGSDVVEVFTYYGHREKLRLIDREKLTAKQDS